VGVHVGISVAFTKITVRYIYLTVNHKIAVRVIFVAVTNIMLYPASMITHAQIRAARALIGWKQVDLAKAAGVSEMSVKNMERGTNDPRVSTLTAIRAALESAGIIFIDENGEGPGVRLRKER
jgi:DNA-binding XRE family transcriptional regulator